MEPSDATLDLRQAAGTLFVRVTGPLQGHALLRLRQAMYRAWFDGVSVVELELSGCSFLGSPAAAFLVDTNRTARYRGGTLTITDPSPAVQRFLARSGLTRILRVAFGAAMSHRLRTSTG